MAKASDHFRTGDVTFWGIVALSCWGAAVLLANISAVVPSSVFAGLHASRMEGATVAQLRTQLAQLSDESKRMRAENNLLLQRFDRAEAATREATQRIGALEVSVPAAMESRSDVSPGIDTMPTASIGEGRVLSFDAEGGSVSVVQKPMVPPVIDSSEATPDAEVPVTADVLAFGLALGFPVNEDDAEAQWQSLSAKVGTLLLGLAPLLQDVEGETTKRIVAGPVTDKSQATQLCKRMDRVGIPCEPLPFTGAPLPLLN